MWPHLVSISSSVKWDQYFLCSLLWGLEIIIVRVQHKAWCTDLTARSWEKLCACVQMMEQNKTGPSREMRDVNRTLGTQQDDMSPGCFHGRVRLDWTWKEWQDIDNVKGGLIPSGRKAVKEGVSFPLLDWSPALLSQGLTSCPHQPLQQSALWCFYCKSPPLLKGHWCASGQMA